MICLLKGGEREKVKKKYAPPVPMVDLSVGYSRWGTWGRFHALADGQTHSYYDSPRLLGLYCSECKREEWYPDGHYYIANDWISKGLHPRFNTYAFLRDYHIEKFGRLPRLQDMDSTRFTVSEAIRAGCTTPTKMKKYFDKHGLGITRHHYEGRYMYVRESEIRKIKRKKVTAEDFLAQTNHELRRLYIHRGGLNIDEVVERMVTVAKSDEGMYLLHENNQQNYLYVKCPSTGETYLLAVPNPRALLGADGQWQHSWQKIAENEKRLIANPAELVHRARMWTLGIEPDDVENYDLVMEA